MLKPVCGVHHTTADRLFYPLSAKNLQMFVLCAPGRAQAYTNHCPSTPLQCTGADRKHTENVPTARRGPQKRRSGCNRWTSSRKRGGRGTQRHREARIAPSWPTGSPLAASLATCCVDHTALRAIAASDSAVPGAIGGPRRENGVVGALNGTEKPELHRVGPLAPYPRLKGARKAAAIPPNARSRTTLRPAAMTMANLTAQTDRVPRPALAPPLQVTGTTRYSTHCRMDSRLMASRG